MIISAKDMINPEWGRCRKSLKIISWKEIRVGPQRRNVFVSKSIEDMTTQGEKMAWASCNLSGDPGKEFLQEIRYMQTLRKAEEQKSCFDFTIDASISMINRQCRCILKIDTGPQRMELSCCKYPICSAYCALPLCKEQDIMFLFHLQVLHFYLLLAEPPLYSAIATAFLPRQPRVGKT